MTENKYHDMLTKGGNFIPPADEYYRRLGAALRQMRVDKKISIDDLADGCGIGGDEIYNWESGLEPITAYDLTMLLSFLEHAPSNN